MQARSAVFLAMGMAVGLPLVANAQSWGPVTVGKSGLGADCSTPSLREAIALATNANLGYDNEVWITDDLDQRFFDGGTLTINGQEVAIIGGYRSSTGQGCRNLVRTSQSFISGQNGAAGSVIAIRGDSYVTLRHLNIGYGQAEKGGGINFSGAGTLVMSDTTLFANSAGRGGGLHVEGSGAISVYLENGVKINDNAATTGGGVYVGGNATLEWVGNDAQMWFNSATGHGGGIYVAGRGRADTRIRGLWGATSQGYHATLYGNVADYGGAFATGQGAVIRVARFDAANPTVIAYNNARLQGGAFHVGGFSELCVNDASLIGNVAERGAAIYSALAPHGRYDFPPPGNAIKINGSDCGFTSAVARCPAGGFCSRIESNLAGVGAVIDVDSGTVLNSFSATRTLFANNAGSHLVYMGRGPNILKLQRNLVVDNHLNAIVKANVQSFIAQHNTVAANQLQGVFDIDFAARGWPDAAILAANIIAQPGTTALQYTGQAPFQADVYDNLTHDATLALWNSRNMTGAPIFDHARGWYQLHVSSPGVDAVNAGLSGDLLQRNVVDLPQVSNRNGFIADVGALERQL